LWGNPLPQLLIDGNQTPWLHPTKAPKWYIAQKRARNLIPRVTNSTSRGLIPTKKNTRISRAYCLGRKKKYERNRIIGAKLRRGRTHGSLRAEADRAEWRWPGACANPSLGRSRRKPAARWRRRTAEAAASCCGVRVCLPAYEDLAFQVSPPRTRCSFSVRGLGQAGPGLSPSSIHHDRVWYNHGPIWSWTSRASCGLGLHQWSLLKCTRAKE
jgi:hypothetical protein